ncbi:hypothetical protein HNY73_010983 [Argiope bruennichi]|uniref:Uncharacterized protein n=1 Tax=Argiope bruennichi TaxID=94029 RepID=A0A8T0F7N4_ARGBR|nr:hypothetical protein HNY73_010983 [Argiope bruennichi]
MLLCVAGSSGAEFRRDRPQAGSRCSSQSFLIKSNANQQVMVEERCSMTSSAASNDHVAARATLSLHLKSNKVPVNSHSCSKESSVAYKSRVIVVSGEGATFSSCSDKGETCSTTTTFKSNVVNGKRGTNTILVRYKPSKPVSEDSDDELQFEFSAKDDDAYPTALSSSPPSSASSESSSIKKDKPSISAWAQIMELEGYRSPAVGLDNGPSKRVPSESDSISNFSSLSAESYRSELSKPSESSYSYERQTGDEGRFKKHNIISIASKCSPSNVNDSAESCAENLNNRYVKDISLNPDGSNQMQILSMRPKGFVPNRYSDTVNSVSTNDSSGVPQLHNKMPPKCKSSMYRSESSRVSKLPSQEKYKYRRKTLPDGNLSLNASDAALNKPDSVVKNQKSPEHDPNASWGRYNSRAMRDSVRKVAEKYAETVYMRRQTRSQLDSLPESKRVEMTRCIAHLNDHVHAHVSRRELPFQNHLYLSKRANSTSHLHEIPSEKESSNRNRLHFVMPASLRHDHASMHAINNCHKTVAHYKPKEWKMKHDQDEEANFISSENSKLNSSIDEDSLNSVDVSKLLPVSDFNYENIQNSSSDKVAIDSDFSNNNLKEDKCRSILSHTKKYLCSNPITSSQSISSIECRISSANAKPFQVSVRMQDVKSKLCADCAQSTELGPPNKQSACRAKHHISDACLHQDVMVSQISLLKRAPLVIDEGNSSPPLYLRPANSKFSNGPRKCTMLSAREMEELVHGKESTDSKLNQAGVASKVSNWIQKQKDKRKPVFFIGDSPSFYNEKVNENNSITTSKYPSHKSRRSLSLSSVREGEASRNISDKPDTSDLASLTNGEETALKPNEHKGLFIKRTSSSCSNRGSIRRKDRQGSPAGEEKEFIKNCHCHHNQADGCITSWGNRIHRKPKNCCHKELFFNNDLSDKSYTESLGQSEENQCDSEIPQQKSSIFKKNTGTLVSNNSKVSSEKYFSTSDTLNLHVTNNNLIYGDSLDPSLLGGQGSRHSYSVISTHNSDLSELARPERSSSTKKLLNFKQITRALSLHSLKKKTKEVPVCSNAAAQLPVISLSKWSRGSKRKIENMKYGSLRKSLSYCELTARGAKVSGKLDFPIKSFSKTKISVQKPPSRPASCACASSLRRSVSLYWQFPLQKTQEYTIESPKSDLLAKICFSRLHRRNTVLPFLRDVKNKRPETGENSKHHHLNGDTRNSLLDYKHPGTSRPCVLVSTCLINVSN